MKKQIVTVKFDEREMLFQQIEMRSKGGKPKDRFYVARHYGSRDIWIEAKLVRPEIRATALEAMVALRQVDIDGHIIEVISVDWLLARFKPDSETCRFFLSMEDAFDNGATDGKCIYRS